MEVGADVIGAGGAGDVEANDDGSSGDDPRDYKGSDEFMKMFSGRKTGKDHGILKLIDEKESAAGTFEPLTANIYQMAALGMEGTSFFRAGLSYDGAVKIVGLWTIPVIQLLGPCAIMVWAFYQLDWSGAELRWPLHYEAGSDERGVSYIFNSLLCTLLLFLICLYSSASLTHDDETLLKLRLLIWACKKQRENDNVLLTHVGPLINTYVGIMICVDMFLLFLLTDSPKDALFDSLALLFLINLDDIPGQVDTLLPEWPAQMAGNVYWCNVYAKFENMQFKFSRDKDNTYKYNTRGVANPDKVFRRRKEVFERTGVGRSWVYFVGRSIVLRPLVIVLPLAYLCLQASVDGKGAR